MPLMEVRELTAERRDVVVAGRRISYLEAGQGASICLLIHGLAGSSDQWIHTIRALADAHRVLAVDLPGFGRSERASAYGPNEQLATLAAFVDALGVDRYSVVGHSLGSLVACELAARHPERVERVAMTGGPIVTVIDLFHRPLRTLAREPRVGTFVIEAVTAGIAVPAWVRRLIVSRPWARWIALRAYVPHPANLSSSDVHAALSGVGATGVIPTLCQGFGYDPQPALRSLRTPTSIINGARDTICPPADAYAFAAMNPAVRSVHLIPESGHLPMLERPDVFNAALLEFLARGGDGASSGGTGRTPQRRELDDH